MSRRPTGVKKSQRSNGVTTSMTPGATNLDAVQKAASGDAGQRNLANQTSG